MMLKRSHFPKTIRCGRGGHRRRAACGVHVGVILFTKDVDAVNCKNCRNTLVFQEVLSVRRGWCRGWWL